MMPYLICAIMFVAGVALLVGAFAGVTAGAIWGLWMVVACGVLALLAWMVFQV